MGDDHGMARWGHTLGRSVLLVLGAAFTAGSAAITGAIAVGVVLLRLGDRLLVIPVGFVTTAVWCSRRRERSGDDAFTVLAVTSHSGAAAAA